MVMGSFATEPLSEYLLTPSAYLDANNNQVGYPGEFPFIRQPQDHKDPQYLIQV